MVVRSVTTQVGYLKTCITNFNRPIKERNSNVSIWVGLINELPASASDCQEGAQRLPGPGKTHAQALEWLRFAAGDETLDFKDPHCPALNSLCAGDLEKDLLRLKYIGDDTWVLLVQATQSLLQNKKKRMTWQEKESACKSEVTDKSTKVPVLSNAPSFESADLLSLRNTYAALSNLDDKEMASSKDLKPAIKHPSTAASSSSPEAFTTVSTRAIDNGPCVQQLKESSLPFAQLGDKMGAVFRELRKFGSKAPSAIMQQIMSGTVNKQFSNFKELSQAMRQLNTLSAFMSTTLEKKSTLQTATSGREWMKGFVKDRINAAWLLWSCDKRFTTHEKNLQLLCRLGGLQVPDTPTFGKHTETQKQKGDQAVWLTTLEEKLIRVMTDEPTVQTNIRSVLTDCKNRLREKFEANTQNENERVKKLEVEFNKEESPVKQKVKEEDATGTPSVVMEDDKKMDADAKTDNVAANAAAAATAACLKKLKQRHVTLKKQLRNLPLKDDREKLYKTKLVKDWHQNLLEAYSNDWNAYNKLYGECTTMLLEATFGKNDPRCAMSSSYISAEGTLDNTPDGKPKVKVAYSIQSFDKDPPARKVASVGFTMALDEYSDVLKEAFTHLNSMAALGGGTRATATPPHIESLWTSHIFGASPRKRTALMLFLKRFDTFLSNWADTVAVEEKDEDRLLSDVSKLEKLAYDCVCTTTVTFKKVPAKKAVTGGSGTSSEEGQVAEDVEEADDSNVKYRNAMVRNIFNDNHMGLGKKDVEKCFRDVVKPLCSNLYSPFLHEVLDIPLLVQGQQDGHIVVSISKMNSQWTVLEHVLQTRKPGRRAPKNVSRVNLGQLRKKRLYTQACSCRIQGAAQDQKKERLWVRFSNSQGDCGLWKDASTLPDTTTLARKIPHCSLLDGISESVKRRVLFHNVNNDFMQLTERNKYTNETHGGGSLFLGPPPVTITQENKKDGTRKVTLYISKWATTLGTKVVTKKDGYQQENVRNYIFPQTKMLPTQRQQAEEEKGDGEEGIMYVGERVKCGCAAV